MSFAHNYPLDNFIAVDHIKRRFKVSDRLLEDRESLANKTNYVFEIGLRRTIENLRKKDVSIVLLIDIPELIFMPEACLAKKVSCEFNRSDVIERQKVHRDLLSELGREVEGVSVFDSLDVLCDEGSEICSILKDGRTLYRDSHHLSHFGSIEYGKFFADFLDDLDK